MSGSTQGLAERWNAEIEAATARHQAHQPEGLHWWLIADAAQLPEDDYPWSRWVDSGSVVNLLEDHASTMHPEVCPLLMPMRSNCADSLLQTQLHRHPLAFMALLSTHDRPSLSRLLRTRCRVQLPDSRKGLLRYYDAAVMHVLPDVLEQPQWHYLLAPALTWLMVDRNGDIRTIDSGRAGRSFATLTAVQLAMLARLGKPDRVLASLRKNAHIEPDADPFESYRKVAVLAAMLDQHGYEEEAQLYEVAALTKHYSLQQLQSGSLRELVSRYVDDWNGLRVQLAQWTPFASIATIDRAPS